MLKAWGTLPTNQGMQQLESYSAGGTSPALTAAQLTQVPHVGSQEQ